jgi:hypothetical protein
MIGFIVGFMVGCAVMIAFAAVLVAGRGDDK